MFVSANMNEHAMDRSFVAWRMVTIATLLAFQNFAFAKDLPVDPIIKATTECRAGCNGSTTGCQESWETAILAASNGKRLYMNSLTISRTWPGGDTTGLVKEPQWEIKTVPANSPRPVSIIIKPVLNSCEGRDARKQSRTHYEWSVVEGSDKE